MFNIFFFVSRHLQWADLLNYISIADRILRKSQISQSYDTVKQLVETTDMDFRFHVDELLANATS